MTASLPDELIELLEGRTEQEVFALLQWIGKARLAGLAPEVIGQTLVGSGWSQALVHWCLDHSRELEETSQSKPGHREEHAVDKPPRSTVVRRALTGSWWIFHNAAATGDLVKVKTLLERDPGLARTTNWNGYSALESAAEQGHREVANLVAAHGAGAKRTWGPAQNTQLHEAAGKGLEARCSILLESRANVHVRNRWGGTPLHLAAQQGHLSIVRLLLEAGAKVNDVTTDISATPLHAAAKNGHAEVVKYLIDQGADIHAGTSDNLATPLHNAAFYGHHEVARLLCSSGADVNRKCVASYSGKLAAEMDRVNDGATPLHCAAASGSEAVARVLLEFGADRTAKRTNGDSAVEIAEQFNRRELASFLRAKMSKSNNL